MEIHKVYKPAYGSDGKWYPDGPGSGFGFYSGTLWPNWRYKTEAEAEQICRMLNHAYSAGIHEARTQVQVALGIYK